MPIKESYCESYCRDLKRGPPEVESAEHRHTSNCFLNFIQNRLTRAFAPSDNTARLCLMTLAQHQGLGITWLVKSCTFFVVELDFSDLSFPEQAITNGAAAHVLRLPAITPI